MTDATEILRIVNVTLAVIAAVGFFVRVNDVWARVSRGGRVLRVGMLALIATAAYASAENYAQHTPPGIRVPMVTVSCVLVLVGLWISRHDRDPLNTAP